MLETSRVTQQLEEAREFASKIGLRAALEERLAYLGTYAEPRRARCVLHPDPAPYSFSFAMERETRRDEWSPWFSGKLLFHGGGDGERSGSIPTPDAAGSPTMGWAVHLTDS
jgi:hypothetical protein